MQYRKFGRLDWEVSALGFGAMRLPTLENSDRVDEPEATRMIRYAIDRGVNYVDTAYPYHQGQSECVVGRALKDGYREKVKLATKLPVWLVHSWDDCDRYLDEQLERLQLDHVDLIPAPFALPGTLGRSQKDQNIRLGRKGHGQGAIQLSWIFLS